MSIHFCKYYCIILIQFCKLYLRKSFKNMLNIFLPSIQSASWCSFKISNELGQTCNMVLLRFRSVHQKTRQAFTCRVFCDLCLNSNPSVSPRRTYLCCRRRHENKAPPFLCKRKSVHADLHERFPIIWFSFGLRYPDFNPARAKRRIWYSSMIRRQPS